MAVMKMPAVGVESGGDVDFSNPEHQDNISVAYGSWSSSITTTKKPRYILINFNRTNDMTIWLADVQTLTARKIGYNGGFQYTTVTFSDIVQIVSDTAFQIKGQGGNTFNYQVCWWY